MASTATLSTLRDRVELMLQDTGNTIWAEGDLDEAITQALDSYSKVIPHRTIGTITLSAGGREIDISSLTGYLKVERVWWDYDSADPAHPPNWRDFEVWPGDLLFINDAEEPASGDVVRVWTTVPQALKDLRSATATTFAADDESLIIVGAAAIAAMQRAIELAETLTVDGLSNRRLRQWAVLQMDVFEVGLAMLARQAASRESGVAPGGSLDRWDATGDGWY